MTLQPGRVAKCDCGSDWLVAETCHDWYEQVPLTVSPWWLARFCWEWPCLTVWL